MELLALHPFPLFPLSSQRIARLGGEGESAAARSCAADLLRAMGSERFEVGRAEDRSPQWPPGFSGSITHTRELVAVVVRPEGLSRSVGIDAEKIVDDRDADNIERRCLESGELDRMPGTPYSRLELATLAFCAKEALYKCIYPRVRRYIDYKAARVEEIDMASGTLRIRLLPGAAAREFPGGLVLAGSFRFDLGHAFTAFELPPESRT